MSYVIIIVLYFLYIESHIFVIIMITCICTSHIYIHIHIFISLKHYDMDVLLTSLTTNADRPHDFEARNGDGLRKHTLITGTYPKLYRNRWLPKPLSVLDDLWQVRSNWTLPKNDAGKIWSWLLFEKIVQNEPKSNRKTRPKRDPVRTPHEAI